MPADLRAIMGIDRILQIEPPTRLPPAFSPPAQRFALIDLRSKEVGMCPDGLDISLCSPPFPLLSGAELMENPDSFFVPAQLGQSQRSHATLIGDREVCAVLQQESNFFRSVIVRCLH